MNVYQVTNGNEAANFSKAVIDELKRLSLIEPQGSTVVADGVRVFHYRPARRDAKKGTW
jgi:hypothetical protein